ncbi:type II secretion system protein GspD [Achromobacter sp.]|uniref:type II secretion system protein GspD n=1 Tax=Achromobacter sp. TaxID=134375 RepID=UPI003C78AD5A
MNLKPVVLALAASMAMGGCTAPAALKKAFGDDPPPTAAERLSMARAALAKNPGDIEASKNVTSGSVTLEREILQRIRSKMDAGDDQAALNDVMELLAVSPGHMRAQQLNAQLEQRMHLRQDLAEANRLQFDHPAEALDKVDRILQEQPGFAQAEALRSQLQRRDVVRSAARPRLADALRKPVSLNFKAQPIVQILDAISLAAGVDFVLDPDVETATAASIMAKKTTAEDAINLLLRTNQLEKRVLDEHSLLIYPSRADKEKEYRELMVRVFYLNQADATQVLAALRQITAPKNVHLDERANAVLVRDTPEVMAVAERVVAALDIAQSEVTMDVRVLEVNATDELEVGVDYPSDLRFSILSQNENGKITVGDLLHLNQDKIGVGSRNDLSAALNLLQKRGKTKVLANPKIRVRNLEKASIKIGEKVPVVTTTNANGVVTESVNYQDVGLSLQVEPRISLNNEVSVKVSMEVSNLKGEVKTAGGGIVYPMSTRNAETVMTARDGETQVLAGLVNQQQTRGSSGLPGLSVLGWLGSLFGGQKKTDQDTEIVLLLTPHIERAMALPPASDSYFPSGTELRVTVAPLTTRAPVAPAVSAPPLDAALTKPPL